MKAATDNPDAVTSQLSDYDHYTLYEKRGKNDGVPVYQSKSTGMLFAEDATPLIYYEDRLLDLVKLARALIEVQGPDDDVEGIMREMIARKEQFSRVLVAEHIN